MCRGLCVFSCLPMRHASISCYTHARDYLDTRMQETEAGCSVVMLIIIIAANNKMARVRNEAELGDQLLGSVAPPNTAA